MPRDPESDKAPQQSPDNQLAALEKALAERQAADLKKLRDLHELELKRLDFEQKLELRAAMDRIDAGHKADRERLAEQQKKKPLFADRMKELLYPAAALSQVARKRQEEFDRLRQLQIQERKDLIALELQTQKMQRDELREQQAKKLRDVQDAFVNEKDRYIREEQEAPATPCRTFQATSQTEFPAAGRTAALAKSRSDTRSGKTTPASHRNVTPTLKPVLQTASLEGFLPTFQNFFDKSRHRRFVDRSHIFYRHLGVAVPRFSDRTHHKDQFRIPQHGNIRVMC